MKKLLIAGGGYADIPLIKAAKTLGFYVISSGNKADDLGHQYSDLYEPCDFSDKDELLKVSRKYRINAICPCANDFSALSSAYVAEEMGFPGHDSYEKSKIIHYKDMFREFTAKYSVQAPLARTFFNVEKLLDDIDSFQLPIIIKPVDLTGGKGITKIDETSNLEYVVERAAKFAFEQTRENRILVEEFIEGSNHGFSTFIRNGKVVFHFTDNEHYYQNKYMVSGASVPGDVSVKVINKLISECEKIASILGLVDGIFHVQFILKNDIPYIIEVCRRPPGDLYIDFVKYATGIDYPSYIVQAFAGMNVDNIHQSSPKFFMRHCVMTNKVGIISDVTFDASIVENVFEKIMWWKPGDIVSDIFHTKFGIVFLHFDTMREMLYKAKHMQELINVKVC